MQRLTEEVEDAQYVIENVNRRSKKALLGGESSWLSKKVQRVAQLDAITTQLELRNILSMSLSRVFGVGPLVSIPYMYQEELNLGLDLVLFRYSTYRLGASSGDRLQNLVMRDELKARAHGLEHATNLIPLLTPSRPLLLLHGLLNIIVPYLLRRVLRRSLEDNWLNEDTHSWKRRAARALRFLQVAWSTMSLINTFHFLATGQYRTLVERLLGLKMVNGSQQVMRLTHLMYLNQHVFWETIATVLEVLRIGDSIRKITRKASSMVTRRETAPENRCCACLEFPTISQRSSCGHLYCYYCIRSRLLQSEANGSFQCLRCEKQVRSCRPDAQPGIVITN